MTLHHLSRRRVLAGAAGASAAIALGRFAGAQDATPAASPASGEWTWTDVLGATVTLPERPVRIAANLATAAALWDLGIKAIAVFDWTASAYPDGDHVAWGNIDPAQVVNVGDPEGNILPEDLLNQHPDIILTLTYDPTNKADTSGVVPDLADQINQIAPVLVVTDMGATDIQLDRLVALAESLGADMSTSEIVAAREAYEAKVAEVRETAAAKADISVIFADVDPDAFYVAGPDGVSELVFLTSLGVTFANADFEAAGDFWETLSLEQALTYPADVFYNDVYSTWRTLDELQAQPTIAQMPSIAAGQLGDWQRDFPASYEGVTAFLETFLVSLRDAVKVS